MIDILTLIVSCANLVLLLVYPAYARLMAGVMAGVMAAQLDEKEPAPDRTTLVYDDPVRRHRAHIIATDLIESLDWAVVQAVKINHNQDDDLLHAYKILREAKEYWGVNE